MFVGKQSVEDVPDVGHGVDADGRALENGALDKQTRVKHPDFQSLWFTSAAWLKKTGKHTVAKAKKQSWKGGVTPPW